MSIIPLVLKANLLDEDYIDTNDISIADHNLFIYSIVNTKNETNRKDMKLLLYIKLARIICFYLLNSFLIIILYYLIFVFLFSYSFANINNTFNYIEQIKEDEETGKLELLKEDKNWKANKEMMDLNYIYDFIRKAFIIKESFNDGKFIQKHKIEFYQKVQEIKKQT